VRSSRVLNTVDLHVQEAVFTARCNASAVLAMGLGLSVSVPLSQVGVLRKRLNG